MVKKQLVKVVLKNQLLKRAVQMKPVRDWPENIRLTSGDIKPAMILSSD